MNKKVLLIIGMLAIVGMGVGGYLYFGKEKSVNAEEYQPQEEISQEQIRQTIVSLYYENKETKELMPEGRLIDAKQLLENPYKTLAEMLIETPKNEKLQTAVPQGTKINNAELKGETVYIDLSKEFIEGNAGGDTAEKNSVYAIVNTLTELTEVSSVKILIDGQENKEFKDGKIKFTEAFVRVGNK